MTGVEKGSFLDKQTGFREAGDGLLVIDWIMEPGPHNKNIFVGKFYPRIYIKDEFFFWTSSKKTSRNRQLR